MTAYFAAKYSLHFNDSATLVIGLTPRPFPFLSSCLTSFVCIDIHPLARRRPYSYHYKQRNYKGLVVARGKREMVVALRDHRQHSGRTIFKTFRANAAELFPKLLTKLFYDTIFLRLRKNCRATLYRAACRNQAAKPSASTGRLLRFSRYNLRRTVPSFTGKAWRPTTRARPQPQGSLALGWR